MAAKKKHEFHVIIEKDEDGYFVGSIPELPGCHSQAKSLDQLMVRIKEAAQLCLEEYGKDALIHEFVGVQKVAF